MQTSLSLLIWLAESEYNGGSFNGPNLVKTLKSLTMEQVTTAETYEGYTVSNPSTTVGRSTARTWSGRSTA